MPVCFQRARFLGARWALCDCMSMDYFISYIWDSKWLPRMPQERGAASQLGEPTFTGTPGEQRGLGQQFPSKRWTFTHIRAHQGCRKTSRTQLKVDINNNQKACQLQLKIKSEGENRWKQTLSSLQRCFGNNVLCFSFEIRLWPSSHTPLDSASGTDKWSEMVWEMPACTTASWPLYHFISINGMGVLVWNSSNSFLLPGTGPKLSAWRGSTLNAVQRTPVVRAAIHKAGPSCF